MRKEYKKLIDALDMSSPLVEATWVEVKRMCVDEQGARKILSELISIEKDSGFYKEQQPFYTFYRSYVYLYLSEIDRTRNVEDAKKAIENSLKDAKRALSEFRVYGRGYYIYNEALIHWFLGLVCLERSDEPGAQEYLQGAIEQLHVQIETYPPAYYLEKRKCLEFVQQIQKTITAICTQKAQGHKESVQTTIEGFLSIPWLPIVSAVQAGNNGPLWEYPLKPDQTEVPYITLNNDLYILHPVQRGRTKITLQSSKKYAWAPVLGNSMNNASPVTICEHDYVLFESTFGPSAQTPEVNDIVIISLPNAGGYTYSVKRYDKANNMAVSDTTEEGDQYLPISINTEQKILGIVLAVAKWKSKVL